MDYSYLAGSEGDSIAELHSLFLLPVVEPLPADADRHRAQVLIKPKIVLMLWGSIERDENLKPAQHMRSLSEHLARSTSRGVNLAVPATDSLFTPLGEHRCSSNVALTQRWPRCHMVTTGRRAEERLRGRPVAPRLTTSQRKETGIQSWKL